MHKTVKPLFLTMSLLVLSLTSTATPPDQVEKILGYQPTKTGVIFQVTSGGCTHREDFSTRVTNNSSTGVNELTLLRIRQDLCYPLIPIGERFSFSYREMGLPIGDRFTVKNPNGIVYGFVWPE